MSFTEHRGMKALGDIARHADEKTRQRIWEWVTKHAQLFSVSKQFVFNPDAIIDEGALLANEAREEISEGLKQHVLVERDYLTGPGRDPITLIRASLIVLK